MIEMYKQLEAEEDLKHIKIYNRDNKLKSLWIYN